MGLAEVLTIVFVVLKLCGVITWAWIWVFSPLWIVYGSILIIFLMFAVFFLACTFTAKFLDEW
jgi:hypothetical protein